MRYGQTRGIQTGIDWSLDLKDWRLRRLTVVGLTVLHWNRMLITLVMRAKVNPCTLCHLVDVLNPTSLCWKFSPLRR